MGDPIDHSLEKMEAADREWEGLRGDCLDFGGSDPRQVGARDVGEMLVAYHQRERALLDIDSELVQGDVD